MYKILNAARNLVDAVQQTAEETTTSLKADLLGRAESFIAKQKGKPMIIDNSTKLGDIEVNDIPVPSKEEGEIVVLEKGANLNLSDELVNTPIGCSIEWDEVKFGHEFDVDVSCLLVAHDGPNELVYFGTKHPSGKLMSKCESVLHTGDNLTGADDAVEGVAVNEDDETIFVKLSQLPTSVDKVVFLVNIYNAEIKGQTFGTTSTMQARLYDVPTGHIFMEANLMENNAINRSMIIGEFYRNEGGWKYKNIALGSGNSSLQALVDAYK